MKTKLYLICLLLVSCQSNDVELNDVIQQDNTTNIELLKGYTYPLSKEFQSNNLKTVTRGGTIFEEDWENCQNVTLANGSVVSLPWSTISDGNIPVNVAYDIKKEDGWEMLFHSF